MLFVIYAINTNLT